MLLILVPPDTLSLSLFTVLIQMCSSDAGGAAADRERLRLVGVKSGWLHARSTFRVGVVCFGLCYVTFFWFWQWHFEEIETGRTDVAVGREWLPRNGWIRSGKERLLGRGPSHHVYIP